MERTQSMTDASAPPRVLSGSYVDLPAVIGGAVLAAAAMSVFTAFGGALGFSSFSAEPGEGGSFTFWAVISVIWVAMTTLFSFAGGGYVTGRLRRRLEDASADEVAARDGLNGLIVWGLGVLLGAWLAAGLVGGVASMAGSAVSAVGSVAGGAVQAAGAAVGGVAQGVGSAAEGQGGSAFDYVTDTLLRPALDGAQQSNGSLTPTRPSMDDSELARQAGMILGNVLRTGEISEDETAFLKAATAQRTGMSEAEVEETLAKILDIWAKTCNAVRRE